MGKFLKVLPSPTTSHTAIEYLNSDHIQIITCRTDILTDELKNVGAITSNGTIVLLDIEDKNVIDFLNENNID